jgi:type II secretory ATPase GspE/PulE/Tfp pilus assembly ATPase PilB-like protein
MAYGQTGSGKTYTMQHLISASVFQISNTLVGMKT